MTDQQPKADIDQLILQLKNGSEGQKAIQELSIQLQKDKNSFKNRLSDIFLVLNPCLQDDRKADATQLTIDIIQNFPNDIERYIAPNLQYVVSNLGDDKQNVRKGSHNCLLSFLRAVQNFDSVCNAFNRFGLGHSNWINKQKSINSFQSLILYEGRFINWSSLELKQLLESLIPLVNYQQSNVAKATEQALISLIKIPNFKTVCKYLTMNHIQQLQQFIQIQKDNEVLPNDFYLDTGNLPGTPNTITRDQSPARSVSGSTISQSITQSQTQSQQQQSQNSLQQMPSQQNSTMNQFNVSSSSSHPFQNVGQNIASFNITNNFLNTTNTSLYSQQTAGQQSTQYGFNQNGSYNGTQYSTNNNNFNNNSNNNSQQLQQPQQKGGNDIGQSIQQLQNDISPQKAPQNMKKTINQNTNIGTTNINDNNQTSFYPYFGFLTQTQYDGLNDSKDWKARQIAIEEILQSTKSQLVQKELENHMLEFCQILGKLINDQNFKTSITALQVIHQIIHLPSFSSNQVMEIMIPKLAQKLGDSKLAIRQTTSKIIFDHFNTHKKAQWIDNLLSNLKTKNSHMKEEALNLINQFFLNENYIPYNWEKILNEISPLLEDDKTRIKILSLECLVSVTMKNNREQCRGFLSSKLHQVYFDRFIEKLAQTIQLQSENQQQKVGFNRNMKQQNKFGKQKEKGDTYDSNFSGKPSPYNSNMISTDKSMGGNSEYCNVLSDSKFSTGNSMYKSNNKNAQNVGSYLFELSSASSSRSTARPYTNNSIGGQNLKSRNMGAPLPPTGMNQNIRIQSAQNTLENVKTFDDSSEKRTTTATSQYQPTTPPQDQDRSQQSIQSQQTQQTQRPPQNPQSFNMYKFKSENNPQTEQDNLQIDPMNLSSNSKARSSSNNNIFSSSSIKNQQQQNPQQSDGEEEDEEDTGSYNPSIQEKKSVRKLNNNNQNSQMNSQSNSPYQGKGVVNNGQFSSYVSEKQIGDDGSGVEQSTQGNQSNCSLNNSNSQSQQQQKIQVKNNVFEPPINMFQKQNSGISNGDNGEEKTEQQSTPYQYKPPLGKKFNQKIQQKIQQANQTTAPVGIQQEENKFNGDGLVIQSKEYQNKNQVINEVQDESSPDELSKQKNIFKISSIKSKKQAQQNQQNGGYPNNFEENDQEDRERQNDYYDGKQQPKSDKMVRKTFKRKQEPTLSTKIEGQSLGDYKQQSYMTFHELSPLNNPEQAYKQMQINVKLTDDWSKQFEAINTCRRLVKNHTKLLAQQSFNTFINDLSKLIVNLRSSLAKNAMLAFQEISEKSRRILDPHLEKVFTQLIKKGSDANVFIQEEVKKSFVSLASNQSENKVLSLIFGSTQTKVTYTKCHLILCLETIIEKNSESRNLPNNLNYDKIIQILGNWLTDNALDVRNIAKKAFGSLIRYNNKNDIIRICKQVFSEQQFNKINQFIQQESYMNENDQASKTFTDIKLKLQQTFTQLENNNHNQQSLSPIQGTRIQRPNRNSINRSSNNSTNNNQIQNQRYGSGSKQDTYNHNSIRSLENFRENQQEQQEYDDEEDCEYEEENESEAYDSEREEEEERNQDSGDEKKKEKQKTTLKNLNMFKSQSQSPEIKQKKQQTMVEMETEDQILGTMQLKRNVSASVQQQYTEYNQEQNHSDNEIAHQSQQKVRSSSNNLKNSFNKTGKQNYNSGQKSRYNDNEDQRITSSNELSRQQQVKTSQDGGYNRTVKLSSTILKPGGPRTSQSTLRDPQIFEDLPTMYLDADNSDWNKRYQLVTKLTKIAQDFPKNICKPKHSQKFLDNFKKLIQDNNFKVQLNALKNFKTLIPEIKQGIEQNILVIGNSLLNSLGSNNTQIRNQSQLVFDDMCSILELPILYPLICNQSSYGIQKARVALLKKLSDLTIQTNEIRQNFVAKHLSSVLIKGLEDNNKEIKNSTKQLIQQLHGIIGEQLLVEIPQNKRSLYKGVLE